MSNPPSVDIDGWTTKKTRQNKRKSKKPKVPKQNAVKSNNNKKSNRNQRRKRNKIAQNQSKNGFNPDDNKHDGIQFVINQITACYPRFKSDRNTLETVVKEMNLKSFNPNDLGLKANVLECIQKNKLKIFMAENEIINAANAANNIQLEKNKEITLKQSNEHQDTRQNAINHQQEPHDRDDVDVDVDEDEDEEDDQDEDDDDEDDIDDDEDIDDDDEEEEDDDDDDDDDNDEESLDLKESSTSPQKSVSHDDDDKESKSSYREEPQRKRKRKRARRRRKKEDEDHDEDHDNDNAKDNENENVNDNESDKPKKKMKKKLTLNDHLRNLDLRDTVTSRQTLSEWIKALQKENNGVFLNAFMKANGLEIIAEKLILNDNGQNNHYNHLMPALFEILLCGTRDYHQWLFNKLVKLGQKLKDLNVSAQSNMNHTELVSIISLQTRHLIRAQTKSVSKCNEIVMNRDESFSRPSDLLHGGHQEKDPIVPVLSSLDEEVSTLTDLYNSLLLHDSAFSTKVNYDLSGYASIESALRENISIIGHKSTSLEQELFAMKNEQNELNKEKEMQLIDIRQRLENRKDEKYRLVQEKKRIEAELFKINESLQKNDMLMEETNAKRLKITSSYQPKMERLYDSMHDHQFEIAGYAQESSVFSALLKLTSESYNLLDSFRDNLDVENNQQRNEFEQNYINHLARYLDKLCDAKMMVINRQNELKQHIESFKKTNETTNKYYALSLNISQQLNQYKNMLTVDEKTNVNITSNIYKNIDEAQKIISLNLFKKFINHLQQNQQIANIIDLTKYTITDRDRDTMKKQSKNELQNKEAMSTMNTMTMNKQSTNITLNNRNNNNNNINIMNNNNNNHHQQINGRSKPPFIKNKGINIHHPNHPNHAPNVHNQSHRRPPRPHYQQPQNPLSSSSKRRPPARSNIMNNKLYHQQF